MVVENPQTVLRRAVQGASDTLRVNWHLGFAAFGGPPVHFKIFHDKFVKRLKWIDEQMSTWRPGMLGLSIGVSNVSEALPGPVYSLLSGLNSATVGIITLAAVELSDKAVTDKLTRVIVFLTASAGMLYNALWYFPVLVFAAGCATVVHDYRWVHPPARAAWRWLRPPGTGARRRDADDVEERASGVSTPAVPLRIPQTGIDSLHFRRDMTAESTRANNDNDNNTASQTGPEPRVIPQEYRLSMSWKAGIGIIGVFFTTFIAVMVLRGSLSQTPPFLFRLFANMYLAGTIIFGGGPVVIPLLREYVVAEGWVSLRDFLVGLAGSPLIAGSVIAFLGIFLPGIVLVHGTMGVWGGLRSRRWVKSGVRGLNAEPWGLSTRPCGYIDMGFQSGRSLGDDPWWVVVAASAYVGGRYFGVVPPIAIVLGSVLGLVRYGVVN
ncbi:hypothetical protein PG994_002835 [Apiospora phragmitis]|uniref:Chromate transporter n=1 Tax=Apiospora phragmitis TaxID=2905665 RepID=A0ABR1W6D9_9PEZI